jgi:ADP-heptose:LPS heptosyltransferase
VRNEFLLPADALAAARKFLAANQLNPDQPLLVIQPLTSSPQKNWPLENYLAVARHWRERGVQVIFSGGPADAPLLEPVRAEKFCAATSLPLLVSAGLVQLAALTLGGDTGLGHLAVAQGRRVVMLMMHKNPGACVPYQHADWALVPANSGNLRDLAVPAVLAETGKVLAANC